MTRLVLHIDRLVLKNIDRHDAAAVAAGVQVELQRLLAEPGVAQALTARGDRVCIQTAPATIVPGAGGRATGQRIAASIANGAALSGIGMQCTDCLLGRPSPVLDTADRALERDIRQETR